jgi:hypothetical protein
VANILSALNSLMAKVYSRTYVDICRIRDSSVAIVASYGLDGWGSIKVERRDFLFSTASRLVLEPTHSSIQWVLGALFLGVTQPGREDDRSPPSGAEVRNDEAIPPLPHTS